MTLARQVPLRTDPVWRSVRRTLVRLGNIWGWPELPKQVAVVFAPRLTRSLGRATPATARIALHVALVAAPRRLLREVLCHEAAHIIAYRMYGPAIRPHGPEWAELIRQAGYEPSRELAVAQDLPGLAESPGHSDGAPRYLHLCPVCRATRVAKRRITRWRCKACVDAGLPGELEVRRIVS